MKPFRLKTTTIELIIFFVVILTLSEILSLGYRYFDRAEALKTLEAVRIADRIAVVTALIQHATNDQRPDLIRGFQDSDLPATLATDPWPKTGVTENQETLRLRDLLRRIIPSSVAGDITVGYLASKSSLSARAETGLARRWREAGWFPEPVAQIINKLTAEPTFLVSLRLDDGSWLNLTAAYVEDIEFWPAQTILLVAAMIVAVAVLSIWAIARLTAPIQTFAKAAIRLGTDINAAPIAERGPADVRGAIRAFNEMQTRLQRLVEERTQMLAAVSHDLRTPVARLRLRAEWVANRTQRAKLLADLTEMEHMITGFLDFAREDAPSEPRVRVDLGATLQSICDDLADKGFVVSFKTNGRLPLVCRPVSIRRCLGNLIENAVKYGRQAEVSMVADGTDLFVHIDDHGPGIPDAFREAVFRPFFRMEGSRNRDSGGSGLGLTIARTVARAHGGDVHLDRAPCGGLRATVILPTPGAADH